MEYEDKNLTPMMRQYAMIKKEHQDKVLFFRLGDFYEMFDEDAIRISKVLNLTLTHRGKVPMCGIPFHAVKNYLKRLLDCGIKVALCEQFVDPDNPRELAQRKVTQVYTPATVVDDEYLDSLSASFILSLNIDRKSIYIAWSDISTGEFYIRTLPYEKDLTQLENAISTIAPKEILVADDLYFTLKDLKAVIDSQNAIITKLPSWFFSLKEGIKQTEKQFSPNALRLFSIDKKDPILTSIGALLAYLSDTAREELPQLRVIERITDESYMGLDSAAIRNLELITSLNNENKNDGTLFKTINRTKTPSGARYLKFSLIHPSTDINEIKKRLGWVKSLYGDRKELDRIRDYLGQISDLERLSIKSSMKKVTPRDLIAIAESIVSFFSIIDGNETYLSLIDEDISSSFSSVIEFSSDIIKAINKECTNIANSGTIILDGFDSELDRLRQYVSNGSGVLEEYLDKVRNESGITNIKVGENRIIGSYIEVSKGQLDKVPDYFIRRQTLVGGERFTTNELEEIKAKLTSAELDAAKREKEVFNAFVSRSFELYQKLEGISKIITKLDFFSSLAYLALELDWNEPEIIEEGELTVVDGRHPVVESYVSRSGYVSNSFSTEKSRFALITGPNMAGKSTYLRQIAIIVLLSHIGSFVPAKSATIPIFDKIFCRVGASDNLSKGESTFLVEMSESAQILRGCTRRSLVIMDEIGRGTSTQDGMSLAYAIMNYLKLSGAITLFATHYHELTMLDTSNMQLLHMDVKEDKNNIVFLRKAVEGVAASSYGIHVAKIAGIPRSVISEATSFQKKHFADYSVFDSTQGDLFMQGDVEEESIKDEICSQILDYDIDNSTPLEAFLTLSELKKKLQEN